jgi:hypothetical protein
LVRIIFFVSAMGAAIFVEQAKSTVPLAAIAIQKSQRLIQLWDWF